MIALAHPAPAVRVVSFAQDAIVLQAAFGAVAARAKLESRSGSAGSEQKKVRIVV